MKFCLAALLLLFKVIATPIALAQSTGEDPPSASDEAAAPPPVAPLNVQPAGIARQDWEPGLAAVQGIPSPIGDALPGFPLITIQEIGAQATMYLDGQLHLYTYNCPAGRCRSFATALWRLTATDDRIAYLQRVGTALMETYPGLSMYVVVVQGSDKEGPVGANWTWTQGDGESYFFVPAL